MLLQNNSEEIDIKKMRTHSNMSMTIDQFGVNEKLQTNASKTTLALETIPEKVNAIPLTKHQQSKFIDVSFNRTKT